MAVDGFTSSESTRVGSTRTVPTIALDQYHTLEQIYSWLDSVNTSCGDQCSLSILGSTFEGRDLRMMKVVSHDQFA